LLHYAQEVGAPEEFEVGLTELLRQQSARKVYHLRSRCQTRHAAVAVEIRAYTYVFYACHIDHVADMSHGIEDGGLRGVAEEPVVEGGLCYTALSGKSPQLVVGEVTRMVAESAAGGVRAHYGL
jgi:hypothetical protein